MCLIDLLEPSTNVSCEVRSVNNFFNLDLSLRSWRVSLYPWILLSVYYKAWALYKGVVTAKCCAVKFPFLVALSWRSTTGFPMELDHFVTAVLAFFFPKKLCMLYIFTISPSSSIIRYHNHRKRWKKDIFRKFPSKRVFGYHISAPSCRSDQL